MANSKAKDNIFKVIFSKPELFIEFLQSFVKIDLFDDLQPSDIEDMSERYLPLYHDSKESDTIKRIHLKGDTPLFVIAILEHESKVNYRASFKMLQYMALVLNEYEKEVNQKKPKASYAKDFKYPPVLPIIFYDGPGKWTAARNFYDKTELNAAFEKYIPKFEYELVNLNDYSQTDIAQFGNALSVVMIMDKIRTPDGMSLLKDLPADYAERLKLNIPPSMTQLIADVITLLLKKINVPNDEIDAVSEAIYQRRYQKMFAFTENYDVQETRRIAREEGREEGREENRKEIFLNMAKSNFTPEQMSEYTGIPLEEVQRLLAELEKQSL